MRKILALVFGSSVGIAAAQADEEPFEPGECTGIVPDLELEPSDRVDPTRRFPDPFPRGQDFVSCGCFNGTIVEFCSGPCEHVEALCDAACLGFGGVTLFSTCVPGGCPRY
jgi:hypothetical protein